MKRNATAAVLSFFLAMQPCTNVVMAEAYSEVQSADFVTESAQEDQSPAETIETADTEEASEFSQEISMDEISSGESEGETETLGSQAVNPGQEVATEDDSEEDFMDETDPDEEFVEDVLPAQLVPSQVTDLKAASTGYDRIRLTWKTDEEVDGFRIYRKENKKNSTWTALGNVQGQSFIDTGLTAGVEYCYLVRAYNGTMLGEYDKNGVSAKPVPSRPQDLQAVSAGYNRIRITWSEVKGATGYRIYRKTAGGSWKKVKDVSSTSYTDTGLTAGTSYTYTVRPYTGSVYGSYSVKGVQATPVPAKPQNLQAVSASYNKITLTWSSVQGATGYGIYRKEDNVWKRIGSSVTGSYTDTGLTAGTEYIYTVRPFCRSVYGEYDKTGVSAITQLMTPQLESASFSGSIIQVKWSGVSGADGYRIYRRAEGEKWQALTSLKGGDTLTYADMTVQKGKTYSYTVRAYKILEGRTVFSSYDQNGLVVFTKASETCIDLSYWDGDVDFAKVKTEVDCVILREGYGTTRDTKFLQYVSDCNTNGVKIHGVYHFIYSLTAAEARKEALNAIANVKKAGLPQTTRIWCDLEYDTITKAKAKGVTLGAKEINAFTVAFCETIEAAGYPTGIYTNLDYYRNYYTSTTLSKWPIWLADYTGAADYPCVVHQYSSSGRVSGISTNVDMNDCYLDD